MTFTIPVILLKEFIILPNQESTIILDNKISKIAIKEASLTSNGKILVVAPRDSKEEEPSVDDLPKVGVVAKIITKIAQDDGKVKLTIKGIKRVAVERYFSAKDKDFLYSEVMEIDLPKIEEKEEKAIKRKLLNLLKEYIDSADNISNSILGTIKNVNDLEKITDRITSFLPFDVYKKIEYMELINPLKRAMNLINDMEEEIKYLKIDEEINEKVRKGLENNQKEFILKERLKVIKEELGEESLKNEEIRELRSILEKLKIAKNIKEKIGHEIDKFEVMNEASPEVSILRNYLDWILGLPWNKTSKEEKDVKVVEEKLNKSHYGLDKVKGRICEYVALKNKNWHIKSPIICLIGPPGIGKTTIAMSIAKSLNRKFYKISVGGLNDATELIGSRRTYIGANPGKIIQGLKKCGTKNPIFLIDEVDKMVRDYKGDPASVLLEILDPTQNKYFVDNYIEEPFDLSEVLFVLTANSKDDIPLVLLDRVEVIDLNSYTLFEKKDIAKKYLLPKIYGDYKLKNVKLKFSDEMLYFLINSYTLEAGVRDLERTLASLIRKIVINEVKHINKEKVIKLLGEVKYSDEDEVSENIPGIVNMLAVSNSKGVVTKCEVIKTKGNGLVTITGSVGKVMEESIKVAMSYVKKEYNQVLNNIDLHFHFLDATTKKDGASAGVSITVALLSVLLRQSVPLDVAFTGEITLNGNILKIGGLKEKLIGAYNKGIKIVYLPTCNKNDLKEVPKEILDEVTIVFVNNFKEIYTTLFK